MDSLLGGVLCVWIVTATRAWGGETCGHCVDLWQLPHSVGGSTGQMQSWNCSSPRLKHHKQQTHYLPAMCQWGVFGNMASQTRGQLACVPWSLASPYWLGDLPNATHKHACTHTHTLWGLSVSSLQSALLLPLSSSALSVSQPVHRGKEH